MIELRKWSVVIVIAVLFAVFVNATIDAVYKTPDYSDFCKQNYFPKPVPVVEPVVDSGSAAKPDWYNTRYNCSEFIDVSDDVKQGCIEQGGSVDYTRDAVGCPLEYKCEMCNAKFTAAQKEHNKIKFLVSAILGLIAIIIGLMLPQERAINDWIGSGLILGGLIAIFAGTIASYNYLIPVYRPFIILGEILIVIYLAYKKLDDHKGAEPNKPSKQKAK